MPKFPIKLLDEWSSEQDQYEKAIVDADHRLELMKRREKASKVCTFCHTRYHTDDCEWAIELGLVGKDDLPPIAYEELPDT